MNIFSALFQQKEATARLVSVAKLGKNRGLS